MQNNLINRIEPIASKRGWTEERTGLHECEFIETRRHSFQELVPHHTYGTVNVLNLVQGDEIIVESPKGKSLFQLKDEPEGSEDTIEAYVRGTFLT